MSDPISERNPVPSPVGGTPSSSGMIDAVAGYLIVYGIAALIVGVLSLAVGWLMLRHSPSANQKRQFWIAVLVPPSILTIGFYGLVALSVWKGKTQHIFDAPLGVHLLLPFIFVVSWIVVTGVSRGIGKRKLRSASAAFD